MSVMKFIVMMLAFEFDSGPLPGHAGHAGRSCKPPPTGLQPLPDLATTDLHLVADDWSGSGNWASRVGGFTANVTGAPAKIVSTQFPGRFEIGSFTGTAAFRLPANAAHTIQNADAITYEWIVKTPTAVTLQKVPGGYVSAANTQIFNMAFVQNLSGNIESAVYNSAIAIYLGTAGVFGVWQMTAKHNLLTLVIDTASPRYEVYINGASVFTDTTTAGTLVPTNTDFGVGGRWSAVAAAFLDPWDEGATIMEVVRHREALDDSTVASRAAAFNAAKGY